MTNMYANVSAAYAAHDAGHDSCALLGTAGFSAPSSNGSLYCKGCYFEGFIGTATDDVITGPSERVLCECGNRNGVDIDVCEQCHAEGILPMPCEVDHAHTRASSYTDWCTCSPAPVSARTSVSDNTTLCTVAASMPHADVLEVEDGALYPAVDLYNVRGQYARKGL